MNYRGRRNDVGLTCLPSPPWRPSDKRRSRPLLVSAPRSSACAAGRGWMFAGPERLWLQPGPDSAALRSDWIQLSCTVPRSLSGNNTPRSAPASPSPLSPPAYKHMRTHTSQFQTGIFKYVMQCVSISVPREEEPSTSSVGCQLCDTRQEVGGGKKGLKRKKDTGDSGCHSEASHELRFIIHYRPSHRLLSGSTHF